MASPNEIRAVDDLRKSLGLCWRPSGHIKCGGELVPFWSCFEFPRNESAVALDRVTVSNDIETFTEIRIQGWDGVAYVREMAGEKLAGRTANGRPESSDARGYRTAVSDIQRSG